VIQYTLGRNNTRDTVASEMAYVPEFLEFLQEFLSEIPFRDSFQEFLLRIPAGIPLRNSCQPQY
jgi:hypothetical protein